MKQLRAALLIAVAFLTLASFADEKPKPAPATTAAATTPANPAFEKIKSLAGEWEGKMADGKPFSGRFRVISSGSAVVIEEAEASEGDMITVIHPDGAQLMATHYCGAKNQPRYVAVPSSDPNVITFKFKDITNLASPQAGYMSGVVFTLLDPDHHNETWSWHQPGKDQVFTMNFTRKK
jgi:hypothetical protein